MFGATASQLQNGTGPDGAQYLPNSPEKTPSCLAWSSMGNFLAASSWDNTTRCWQLDPQTKTAKFLLSTTLSAPQLNCIWSADGAKIFTAGCDNKVTCWDLASNTQIPTNITHDLPISTIQVTPADGNTVLTGSWDGNFKIWDLRNPSPSFSQNMGQKIYCSDLRESTCILGLGDSQVVYMNFASGLQQALSNPKKVLSKLNYPIRSLALFADNQGFAAGSIEGRVSIQNFTDPDPKKSFLFKCHRNGDQIFPVNDISFHPKEGTFSTCGSDAHYHFWDKDAKSRIKQSPQLKSCIPVGKFSKCGTYFAYAEYYDYFKGPGGEGSAYPNCGVSYRFVGDDAKKKKK